MWIAIQVNLDFAALWFSNSIPIREWVEENALVEEHKSRKFHIPLGENYIFCSEFLNLGSLILGEKK